MVFFTNLMRVLKNGSLKKFLISIRYIIDNASLRRYEQLEVYAVDNKITEIVCAVYVRRLVVGFNWSKCRYTTHVAPSTVYRWSHALSCQVVTHLLRACYLLRRVWEIECTGFSLKVFFV